MSANLVPIGAVGNFADSWQLAADGSDEVSELIAALPGGDNGYELTPETDQKLRKAAALLEQAVELLRRASEREIPRYEKWCDEHEWALELEDEAAKAECEAVIQGRDVASRGMQ